MYNAKVYNWNWEFINTVELPTWIFDENKINNDLIHEFLILQRANSRINIAKTKNRSEVRMSWRKLYKQKKTWNARVWNASSPIRRHWWICFWPDWQRNYKKSMPKKMRQLALIWSLTLKAKNNEILMMNDYEKVNSTIKTKVAKSILNKIWIENNKVLVVIDRKSDVLIKSFRNIENVKYVFANYVNPYDLLTYKYVLMMDESLSLIENNLKN